MTIQLDFLKDIDPTPLSREEFSAVKSQLDNTRRGLFRRFDELAKLYLKQQKEIEQMRRQVQLSSLSFEYLKAHPKMFLDFVEHHLNKNICALCGDEMDEDFAVCNKCKNI